MSDIALTASMRNVLVSLQETSGLMNRTQERLATGKKVNSALDNPANYFAAKGHTDRANQLNGRKDAMGEAIQTIKAADKAVKAISGMIENLRGIISQARSAVGDASQMGALSTQFNTVLTQMNNIAADAGYKGVNLVNGTGVTLTVVFNEAGTNTLDVGSFDATTNGLSIAATSWNASTTQGDLNTLESTLNTALNTLRSNSATLASNLSIIQSRVDFTTDLVNTLIEGANKLTAADTNEEGANMLMLQTRMQLGTTSLSLASQAAQSVLRLF